MRHRVYGKHLGRTKNERTSLFRNLIGSLLLHGSIQTTQAKAKAIKPAVDKIINQAKYENTKRLVGQFLTQKKVQEKLFQEVVPNLSTRNSGYTSMVKVGPRMGDNAMMVRISLLVSEKSEAKTIKKAPATGRTLRSSKKKI